MMIRGEEEVEITGTVGVVWCGVVWCGVVWYGMVWCGMVWCGVLSDMLCLIYCVV